LKIKKILTASGLAAVILTSFCFGCKTDNGNTNVLPDGVITYANAICESIKGVENSGTVATATASNGARVSYSLTEEDAGKLNNAFGGALSIDAEGTIKGKYDGNKRFKVDVTASAEKCEAVTAEITINVVNPYLTYTGRTLADARVNLPYATSVAYVENEEAEVTYRLNGKLPEGLAMTDDGTITGTPVKVERGTPFTVIASSKGFSDTRREFVIDVILDHESETPSRIINFGSADGAKELDTAYVGTQYVNQAGVAGNAAALNGNNITYALAGGDTLPEGITLYPNGALIGKADVREEKSFTVTATADHCETVTREFTLAVKPQRIRYESLNGVLVKGEPADYDIATADAGEGIEITYSMTEEDAAALKSQYGLTVTSAGRVTGTPTKVVKLMNFKVTASAEGFSPRTATMYFRINEPLQAPEGGRFEAEYTDLTGKQGTGYSASPAGENLIDMKDISSNGAFVNYMHNDTITLEFVIYAEEAVSNAPLYIAAGSEMGNVTFTPSTLGIYVYGGNTATGDRATVNYGSAKVNGGKTYTSFNEVRFGSVTLAQGWNVIQIAVHTNTLRDGNIGGPGVDYLRVDTSVSLKWVPCTYNIKKG